MLKVSILGGLFKKVQVQGAQKTESESVYTIR